MRPDRPTDRPSAPPAYQCLLSHFLATLGAQEKADCTSMSSSIDSCQNRISADQYQLTVSRAQVSTHQSRVFFVVIRFQMIAGSRLLFCKNSNQICCVYVSISPYNYDFDFKLTQKFRQFFFNTGGEDLLLPWCWSRFTSNFYALIG